MESKFIVIVALAILARGFCAQESSFYGLSTEKSAPLYQIDTNEETALASKYAAFDSAFDILVRLASVLISGLECKPEDSQNVIIEALLRARDSVDCSINSILLVTGKDCPAAETARIASKGNLDELFGLVPLAIGSAASGNSIPNQVESQVVEFAAQKTLADLVVNIYNAIRTCAEINDAEILAAIAANEERSAVGLRHTVNAVLNAIKRLTIASLSGTRDLATVISDLEDERNRALVGIRTDVENKFSTLKALYLIKNLNELGQASDLFTIQYSRSAEFYRHEAAMKSIFHTIRGYLTRVALNLFDAGEDDFSPTDAAEAVTAAKYKAGLRILLDTVLAIDPQASPLVADSWKFFVTYCDEVAATSYNLILSTQTRNTTYNELVANFETLRTVILPSEIGRMVSVIFNTIGKNGTRSSVIEEQLSTLQEAAFTSVNNLVYYYVNEAIVIVLARASYGIETVGREHFAALRIAEGKAVAEIQHFTYLISAARVVLLQNNYVN